MLTFLCISWTFRHFHGTRPANTGTKRPRPGGSPFVGRGCGKAVDGRGRDRRARASDRERTDGTHHEATEAAMADENERTRGRRESDEDRAARVARDVARENPDPTTRREAIEQELSEDDLSEEGGELGQHND
jgi:hypothetical protein